MSSGEEPTVKYRWQDGRAVTKVRKLDFYPGSHENQTDILIPGTVIGAIVRYIWRGEEDQTRHRLVHIMGVYKGEEGTIKNPYFGASRPETPKIELPIFDMTVSVGANPRRELGSLMVQYLRERSTPELYYTNGDSFRPDLGLGGTRNFRQSHFGRVEDSSIYYVPPLETGL